ncbi:hypothetical protein D9M69_670110 [compost metagenome]
MQQEVCIARDAVTGYDFIKAHQLGSKLLSLRFTVAVDLDSNKSQNAKANGFPVQCGAIALYNAVFFKLAHFAPAW